MIDFRFLPHLNAILNTMSMMFLASGYFFIRRKMISYHRGCMISALIVSIAFLGSYLTYHLNRPPVPFGGIGWIRIIYFTILISHVFFAACIVPMALLVLWRAFYQKFESHRRIARITLPVWFYVSFTGVLVYLFLYHPF